MPESEPQRRKSDAERKDDVIRVRVTGEQRETLQAAADAAGLELSTWLRSLGLAAAKKK